MITDYPTPLATWAERSGVRQPPIRDGRRAAAADGSWRYPRRRLSRGVVIAAAVISAALHASFLFGSRLLPKKAAPVARAEAAPVIRLSIPELKELEEPETNSSDEPPPPVDLAVPVPMQADVPSLPAPSDFVQPLNFASLLEQPDLSAATVTIIPEHFIRGARLAEKIGKIFNLADLDRTPEPVLQPAPVYPLAMRREGISGTVHVEFVVNAEGRVLDAQVFDTTHPGFNDAAVGAVSKWKFRPGFKAGARVNTRMRVPIVFSVADPE